MQSYFFSVGRSLPQLATIFFVDEHGSDRYGVSVRAAVWVVATVRIERILDRKLTNRAVIGLDVGCVRIASLAFVLGVEPASTTAIRTTVWHGRTPFKPTRRRGIKLLATRFRVLRRNVSQFSADHRPTVPRHGLRCRWERLRKTPQRSRPLCMPACRRRRRGKQPT